MSLEPFKMLNQESTSIDVLNQIKLIKNRISFIELVKDINKLLKKEQFTSFEKAVINQKLSKKSLELYHEPIL